MSVRVVVRDEAIDIEIRGWFDHAVCLSGDQHIPLADVTGVRVTGWDEPRSEIGWRVGGGYFPGWVATGWFTVPNRKGARQFWAVFRDRERLLVVDTRLERPARLVIATPDADALAAAITERMPAAPGR